LAVAFDRQQNVPRQVYELLRDRILTAELKPGESINERRLADLLGVSRTPIREALRKLATDGLIDIIPSVGTSVALVEPSRIYELCLIRKSLECATAEQAAGRFTKEADRDLERLIDEQEATIASGDMRRNIAVDSEFHRVIHDLSGMPIATDMLRSVMGEVVRARHLSIQLPGRLREPITEHRRILKALRSGDGQRASDAMREHLERSIVSVMQVIKSHPDFVRVQE
jgi:DNA-binding GntR family transcriptional regulator